MSYRLNICALAQNSCAEALTPDVRILGDGAFGRCPELDESGPRDGMIQAETPESLLSLHMCTQRRGHGRPSEVAATCKPREEVQERNLHANTLIWAFPASRTLRNTFPLFKPPSCGILLWSLELTRKEGAGRGKEQRAGRDARSAAVRPYPWRLCGLHEPHN